MAYINKNVSTMAMPSGMNRMGQFPLDMSSVYYDLDSLKAYAKSGAIAYVGQVVSLVDELNNKVTVYSIQDTNGTLKEVGTVPVGDTKTIKVAENGTISLAGIESLQYTDEDGAEISYQALLTKDGLTWVRPSKTTVEGLATLIEGLNGRVSTLETSVGKAAEGSEAATGLFKAIADEAKSRADADTALGGRIDALSQTVEAIDFIDESELTNALQPYAKTEEVNTALSGKVDTSTYATDKKALEDADAALDTAVKAAQKTADDANAAINDFLTGTGAEGVIDSLTEIKQALEDLVDPTELATSIAGKADKVENAQEGNFAGLDANGNLTDSGKKASDFATPAEVKAVDDKFANYTTTEDLNDLLAGKVDTSTYSTDKAALENSIQKVATDAAADATTKANKALEDAKTDAATLYATKTYVGTIPDGYTEQTSVIAYIDKKAEETLSAVQGSSSETVASVKQQLDSYKSENEAKFTKLEGIDAGAQVNKLEGVQLNGTDLQIDSNKKVNIDLAAYALGTTVDAVKATAEKGVADAATAQAKANEAATAASNNAQAISGLDTRLDTAEGNINTNTAAIAAHATEFATLKGRVDGHDATLLDKANKADVYTKEQVNAITGTPSEGKTLAGMIADKANSVDVYTKNEVYTKSEIDGKTGTIPEGSNIMTEIAKAQTAATYDDTAIKASIDAIYKAGEGENAATGVLADEIARAKKAEAANAKSIADLTTAIGNVSNIMNFRGVIDKDGEGYNPEEPFASITDPISGDVVILGEQEYVYNGTSWVLFGDASGNAAAITALTARVEANETAVNTTLPGAIAQALTDAKGYTDNLIAALKVKDVDNTTLQLSETGVASVKAISTDLLVQGELELILNGGSAN